MVSQRISGSFVVTQMDDSYKVVLKALPEALGPLYLKVFLEYRYSELKNREDDYILKSFMHKWALRAVQGSTFPSTQCAEG